MVRPVIGDPWAGGLVVAGWWWRGSHGWIATPRRAPRRWHELARAGEPVVVLARGGYAEGFGCFLVGVVDPGVGMTQLEVMPL